MPPVATSRLGRKRDDPEELRGGVERRDALADYEGLHGNLDHKELKINAINSLDANITPTCCSSSGLSTGATHPSEGRSAKTMLRRIDKRVLFWKHAATYMYVSSPW